MSAVASAEAALKTRGLWNRDLEALILEVQEERIKDPNNVQLRQLPASTLVRFFKFYDRSCPDKVIIDSPRFGSTAYRIQFGRLFYSASYIDNNQRYIDLYPILYSNGIFSSKDNR